ncbi:hypothetical protein [Pseudokordiimonas caeni]|uniref:hypothetical protein n=1 Tax=Pseudokordiimonas caeni TaxID=2997908 RepID=UPI002811923B|nr:hypothetical protein [Pseudokordiimonas caeni]
MSTGPFTLFDTTLAGLLSGAFGNLAVGPVSAVLLTDAYSPDLVADASLADVSIFEVSGGDYAPLSISSPAIVPVAGGAAFSSGDADWGDPVTMPEAKYLVLVKGNAGSLDPGDPLIGFVDLDESGDGVASVNGRFRISTPVGGWFDLTRE